MRKQALALALLSILSLSFAPAQTLSKSSILPGEKPEAILSLPEAGRLSLRAISSSGVPISLHDKMEGRIAGDGLREKKDGRIDISLDAGAYKLVVEAEDSAGKAIGLEARAFKETSGATPEAWPRLIPGRTLSRELFDLQTASYWIELLEDGVIEVEALGRDLAEAELWEGDYLIGSWKPREERTVEGGRPMGWIALSKPAKAGLYLLRLHGGPSRIWPKEDGRRPLHVRSGFLQLPIGGQFEHTISAFGRDFFYSESGGQAVLGRRGKEEAKISVASYEPGASRGTRGGTRELPRTSPELSTSIGLGGGPSLVILEGRPGDVFSLDIGRESGDIDFDGTGSDGGMLASIHLPRGPASSIEPTGLLLAYNSLGQVRLLRDFAAPLSASKDLRRRFNQSGNSELSMFLRVEEGGSYGVAEKRGTGQASAYYSLTRLDGKFQAIGYTEAASAEKALFSLVEGYYILRVRPASLGVLDFIVYKTSLMKRPLDELNKEPPLLRASQSSILSPQELRGRIRLLAASSPASLAEFYPLPLDIERGVSLELGANESLSLPYDLKRPGRLSLRGGSASVSLNGQTLSEGSRLPPGKGNLLLRNPSGQTALARISFEQDFNPLGAAELKAFKVRSSPLALGSPSWLDLGKREKLLYSFEVKESAVYVVESLGRLSTSLTMRSGSRLRLFSAKSNGYGRNASLRTWLRPGRYFVELEAQGESAGRCAIRLDRVPLQAESFLESGAIDRRLQAADTATRFSFTLAAESEIELNSVGLTGLYPIRLEDEEGFLLWSGQGRNRLRLRAGRYAFFSLPLSLETRRLSWFRIQGEALGAAPIAGTRLLPFSRQLEAVWEGSAEWDRYSFSSPSAIRASLRLNEGLEARLSGPGGERDLPSAERGDFPLARGLWELKVRPREKTAKLPYSLALDSLDLAPGLSARVSPGREPVSISLSVPVDGDYEIWSLGRSDLRARLFRADSGELLALGDDSGADWNFSLFRRLQAGRYLLEVLSLGGAEREAEISMVSRIAKELPPAKLPRKGGLALEESGILLPFDTGAEEGIYLIKAKAEAPISLRLYRGEELLASAEGSIAIPLKKGTSYRLHAWAPLALSAELEIAKLPERRAPLSPGFALKMGEALRLDNPEGLSARLVSGELRFSPGLELPFRDPGQAPFSLLKEGGWVWAPEAPAQAEALSIPSGSGAVFSLSEAEQGFLASSAERALLLKADTRGQFRLGISALPAASSGSAPFDWNASASWSQGSLALLPPGDWKLRLWDGQREPGYLRKSGVGVESLELRALPALPAGARKTLVLPPNTALSLELPASTLQALLGEGLLLSAWKDGKALATRSALDDRGSETLNLPACKLLVANLGLKEASIRLALLPARELSEEELSAARPFEAVELPPEGIRLKLRAAPGELLCIAGDPLSLELEAEDGRFILHSRRKDSPLFTSLPASSGQIRLVSEGGFVRAWLAKPGRELEGLLEAKGSGGGREIVDAALLSGRGEAFRLKLAEAGYVDISCQGPGILALSGAGQETRVRVSGSREDMHLFAWLAAGEYGLWQRPAAGSAGGGILRVDRVASAKVEAESLASPSFIAAREYQAWSFRVEAAGLVGVGLKAEEDGLEAFLYDDKQGLLAQGCLMFEELEKGDYLLVVKGLDSSPIEYQLLLEGRAGSRLGLPPEVLASYTEETGSGSSRPVPMHGRGPGWYGPSRSRDGEGEEYGIEEYEDEEYGEGEYYEEGSDEGPDSDGTDEEYDTSYEK